jgi:hypothetical protein
MLPKADGDRVEVPTPNHYIYKDYLKWQLSQPNWQLLAALLEDMQTRGVEVSAIFPPISTAFHDKLKSEAGYRQSTSDIKAILSSAQRNHLLAHACYVEDAAEAGCERSEMMDFVHMLKPCVRKVLRQCEAENELSLPTSSRIATSEDSALP